MKKSTYKKLGIIFLIFIAILSFLEMKFRFSDSLTPKLPGAIFSPNDEKIVSNGREIYFANCGSCHGANLEGEPNWRSPNENGLMPAPPHNENGHTWHHTDKMLFDITKYGFGKVANLTDYKTNMPIYKNILSDKEIIAVLSYIKSTWPEKIQLGHDKRNANSVKLN